MDRRDLLMTLGAGGLGAAALSARAAAEPPTSPQADALADAIAAMPINDTHCHPVSTKDAHTTVDDFLERLSLAAWPLYMHFPEGVYARWRAGDPATRATLDRQYGIVEKRTEALYHFRESVFVKYMTKEMAGFLGCEPQLEAVIEARNARGRDYWGYVSALFRDARFANVMIDTGYAESMSAGEIAEFERAVAPTRSRRVLRVETLQDRLFGEDIGFDELEARYRADLAAGLDGEGNVGTRSYGMKSYLLPKIGLIQPVYDRERARRSWEHFKTAPVAADRAEQALASKDLEQYLLTIALEACLERDMPMQFHAGDGEAPDVILRRQDPYLLEEIVRFDKDGMMRDPKIIPIHAGYPLVSKAAWLSHLYTNCYFELSLMTPFIHQGLLHRYLEIMEAVPLSKILFGSDAYHVPELYWLAARWGKRYLAQALSVYVEQGLLAEEEALEAARMILYKNAARLYHLDP